MPTTTTRSSRSTGSTRPTRPRRPIHAAAAAAVLPLALSFIPTTGQVLNPNCGIRCGVERWGAKTLSDSTATSINMTPQAMSVSQLVNQTAPTVGSETRVPPVETQAVTVHANLLGFKIESDSDLHIVIQDPATKETMIVEIPDKQCSGVCSSIARDQIIQARSTFETAFAGSPPGSEFRALATPVPVDVYGIPLFDFQHPKLQTGLAKNCIEVHPVLSIALPANQPLTTVLGHTPQAPAGMKYTCMPRVSSNE